MIAVSDSRRKMYIEGDYVLRNKEEIDRLPQPQNMSGYLFTMNRLYSQVTKRTHIPEDLKEYIVSMDQYDTLLKLTHDWKRKVDIEGDDEYKSIDHRGFNTKGLKVVRDYSTDVLDFSFRDDENRVCTLEDLVGRLLER